MADQIFENPRLVAIYDAFDVQRRDLDHYVALSKELEAKSVLDIGCGTGCFAHRLAEEGFKVVAVDPARSSIEAAKRKANANQVQWIFGTASDFPAMTADLAVMTGNVAQVFVTDHAWEETPAATRRALAPSGHLVFEVRDPAQKAWLNWTREKTYERINVPGLGFVEGWCEVTNVKNDLVSFRWTYAFESDVQVLTSDSTQRFQERDAIELSLKKTGFAAQRVFLRAPNLQVLEQETAKFCIG